MGYGDFKLFAALGAWLGWQMLPLIILLSAFTGAVVGIALIVAARPRPQHSDSVRPVPRRRRLDRVDVGRRADRLVSARSQAAMRQSAGSSCTARDMNDRSSPADRTHRRHRQRQDRGRGALREARRAGARYGPDRTRRRRAGHADARRSSSRSSARTSSTRRAGSIARACASACSRPAAAARAGGDHSSGDSRRARTALRRRRRRLPDPRDSAAGRNRTHRCLRPRAGRRLSGRGADRRA